MPISRYARLYFQPTGLVASPFGYSEGSVARLAGGLVWFSAYQVIAATGHMTARTLNLDVRYYDVRQNYLDVRY